MVTFIVLDDPVLTLRDSLLTIIQKLVKTCLNLRCQEHMHAMTLRIYVPNFLLSRYNQTLGLFLCLICIVYSSILPVLARAVLWVSTQSVFPYLLFSLVCCSSSLIEGMYYFGNLRLRFQIKIIYFPGLFSNWNLFLLTAFFLLRAIL
jgi:hypothetical protein